MKYIKKITALEFMDGMKEFFKVADVDDFFEVKGLYALDEDLCYATLDNNCFYILRASDSMFGYFALDKGNIINIKGLWEAVYEMVCAGYAWIRINGRIGRYTKLLGKYNYTKPLETYVRGHEEFWWFAGHPDVIKAMDKRRQ